MFRASLLAWVLFAAGCKGSLSAEAQMNADLDGKTTYDEPSDEPNEHDQPLSQSQARAAREAALAGAGAAPAEQETLFGARHDFTVKDSSGAIACRCVSVLLGLPTSGKLSWRGEIPRIKPETQLVLGLIPDAGECPGAPKDSGGASYSGYRVVGNDVIVLLEAWKPSLPRTLGAIIPKPPVGGQVYVAPVNGKLPYGAAATGTERRCAAGNPGARRTRPLSESDARGAAEPDALENGSGE